MQKKALALFLSLVLIVSIAPLSIAADTSYTDVPESHWAYEAINTWSLGENAVLFGIGDGKFAPGTEIEDTAVDAIISRILGSGIEWTAGSSITREAAIVKIALAFGVEQVAKPRSSEKFDDDADISTSARPYVYGLKARGVIAGVGDNKFAPASTLTRAELVQIIYKLVAKIIDKDISGASITEDLVVRSPDVTLTDVQVTGDLIIGQGVEDGDVTLDGVSVSGKLIVYGGGSNSIHIKGRSSIPVVILAKVSHTNSVTGLASEPVSLKVEGADAAVTAVTVEAGNADVQGTVETLTVAETAIEAAVSVTNATIAEIIVDAPAATVSLAGASVITTVTVTETATTTTVEVQGTTTVTTVVTTAVSTTITVSVDAAVTTTEVKGNDAKIGGEGKVSDVKVDSNVTTKTEVSTPNAKVENNSAAEVTDSAGATVAEAGAGSAGTSSGSADSGSTATDNTPAAPSNPPAAPPYNPGTPPADPGTPKDLGTITSSQSATNLQALVYVNFGTALPGLTAANFALKDSSGAAIAISGLSAEANVPAGSKYYFSPSTELTVGATYTVTVTVSGYTAKSTTFIAVQRVSPYYYGGGIRVTFSPAIPGLQASDFAVDKGSVTDAIDAHESNPDLSPVGKVYALTITGLEPSKTYTLTVKGVTATFDTPPELPFTEGGATHELIVGQEYVTINFNVPVQSTLSPDYFYIGGYVEGKETIIKVTDIYNHENNNQSINLTTEQLDYGSVYVIIISIPGYMQANTWLYTFANDYTSLNTALQNPAFTTVVASNVTIPANETLTIPSGKKVVVSNGTLHVDGKLINNGEIIGTAVLSGDSCNFSVPAGEGGSGGELKLVGRDADSVFLMGNPSTVELSFSEANQFIGASLAVNISGQVTLNKPFTIGGTSAVTSIWLAADGHLTIGGTNALTVTQNSGFISPQTGSKITTNGTAGGGLNDYGVDNVSPFESNKTYVATIVDGFATWAELVA